MTRKSHFELQFTFNPRVRGDPVNDRHLPLHVPRRAHLPTFDQPGLNLVQYSLLAGCATLQVSRGSQVFNETNKIIFETIVSTTIVRKNKFDRIQTYRIMIHKIYSFDLASMHCSILSRAHAV